MSPLHWDAASRIAFRPGRGYGAGNKTAAELIPPPDAVVRRDAVISSAVDLLDAATADAVQQLAHTRSKAAFFRVLHTSETTAAEIAEKRWRDRNPGLAVLVDRAKGGAL